MPSGPVGTRYGVLSGARSDPCPVELRSARSRGAWPKAAAWRLGTAPLALIGPATSARRDVVFDVKHVVGVVAPLYADQPLVFRRAEDNARVQRAMPATLLPLEVDVLPASGERVHVRVQTPYKGNPGVVVARIRPEPVDVEPGPGGAVRERSRLLRHPPERTTHVVDVEAGTGPGLLRPPTHEHLDHVDIEPVERGVAPVRPYPLREDRVKGRLPLHPPRIPDLLVVRRGEFAQPAYEGLPGRAIR